MAINTKKYIEEFLKIRSKTAEIIPFRLNKPQQKLYSALKAQAEAGKPQRVIILKARQMGFSTLTEACIFKRTATACNVTSAIVTQKDEATNNLFEMSKRFYTYLPEPIKPQLRASNAKELIFDTRDGQGLSSRIKCFTAGGEGIGRSDTIQNLHISEYAFWPGDKKNTLLGLMQAVPNVPNSVIIIESTANGYEHFKELWDMAVRGESAFTPVFCAWWELDEYRMPDTIDELTAAEQELVALYGLDRTQLSWRRWCIANNCGGDEELFRQEYPSNPHEAFISTGTCVFDKSVIAAKLEQPVKPVKRGEFEYRMGGESITDIRFRETENGIVQIYEEARPGVPYVIGGDTAGEGSDNFVGQVLDNMTGRQVATLKHRTDEDLYAAQMYCLGKYYNTALIGIEANFSTYPIKTLERLEYPKQYVREQTDTYTGGIRKAHGFKTTSTSRPVAIAEFVKAFREDPGIVVDTDTLREMLVFVRNEKGRPEAMPGEHDDCVMAIAIAHAIRPQQDYAEQKTEIEHKTHLPWALQTDGGSSGNGYIEW